MSKENKLEQMRSAAKENNFFFTEDKNSEYDFSLAYELHLFDCNIANNEYYLNSHEGSVIEKKNDYYLKAME